MWKRMRSSIPVGSPTLRAPSGTSRREMWRPACYLRNLTSSRRMPCSGISKRAPRGGVLNSSTSPLDALFGQGQEVFKHDRDPVVVAGRCDHIGQCQQLWVTGLQGITGTCPTQHLLIVALISEGYDVVGMNTQTGRVVGQG